MYLTINLAIELLISIKIFLFRFIYLNFFYYRNKKYFISKYYILIIFNDSNFINFIILLYIFYEL